MCMLWISKEVYHNLMAKKQTRKETKMKIKPIKIIKYTFEKSMLRFSALKKTQLWTPKQNPNSILCILHIPLIFWNRYHKVLLCVNKWNFTAQIRFIAFSILFNNFLGLCIWQYNNFFPLKQKIIRRIVFCLREKYIHTASLKCEALNLF